MRALLSFDSSEYHFPHYLLDAIVCVNWFIFHHSASDCRMEGPEEVILAWAGYCIYTIYSRESIKALC